MRGGEGGATVTSIQRDHAPINTDEERRERALTDEDIAALADALERTLTDRFYHNLGRGFWGLIWRGMILAGMALAAYGYEKGH